MKKLILLTLIVFCSLGLKARDLGNNQYEFYKIKSAIDEYGDTVNIEQTISVKSKARIEAKLADAQEKVDELNVELKAIKESSKGVVYKKKEVVIKPKAPAINWDEIEVLKTLKGFKCNWEDMEMLNN